MKILLDECVDHRLAVDVVGHDVKTVRDMGWSGITNGVLLGIAEKQFDVFVTVDQNLPFQQNMSVLKMAVVILKSPSNKLSDLRPLIPQLLAALPKTERGRFVTIGT